MTAPNEPTAPLTLTEKLHRLTPAEQAAMHECIAIFGLSKVLDEWEGHLTQIRYALKL